ncbi:MAG: hypothetical protein M1832_003832 [Thelocarpon impressellum]|nr:MAG: hypothetical protein M1832_003832 [Thelocarpon impressellum]
MSSMRNAIPRRPHRERAQPTSRSKWGLLEKHADYSLRAKAYAAKKARLRALRHKAADRNPDEFDFGMMRARMSSKSGTKVGDRGNASLGVEAVRLLKTQDTAYLRTVGMKARKEVERLEESAIGLGDAHEQSKVVFADTKEEGVGKILDDEEAEDGKAEKKRDPEREKRRRRLEAARERKSEIEAAERELDLQRARMAKSPGVGGTNKRGVKWKVRERRK